MTARFASIALPRFGSLGHVLGRSFGQIRPLRGFGGNLLSMGTAQIAMRASRLLTTVILTRALLPHDFGMAAIVLTVYELAALFTRNGISAKVVQADAEHVERVAQTALAMTWVCCIALLVLQAAVALPVALAFHEPELALPIALMGLIYLATPLCNIQGAFIQREGRLGRIATAAGLQVVTDNALTATFALAGFGMWAIILPKLIVAPIWVVILRTGHPWRPRPWLGRPGAFEGWRDIFSFSRNVLGVEMMTTLQANIDNLLVGYFLGTAALGIYYFAFNAGLGITLGLVTSFGVAVYPHLCEVRSDPEALERRLRSSMKTLGLITVPIILAQVALAPIYVPLVFGHKWLPAVPVLMIICLSALPRPFASTRSQYLKALGRPDIELKWQVALTLLLIPALLVATQIGIVAVALAVLIVQGSMATLFAIFAPRALKKEQAAAASDPATHFAVIRSEAGIAAIETEWNDLWQRIPGATVSQSFTWCSTGWRIAAEAQRDRLAVIIGRREGRLVLVWPLLVRRNRLVHEARIAGSDSTDYDAMLVEPGPDAAGLAAEAFATLHRFGIADIVETRFVAAESPQAMGLQGWHCRAASQHALAAPFIDHRIHGSWAAYLASRPAKFRNELARRRRQLDAMGAVKAGFVEGEAAVTEAVDWAIAHKRAWLARTGQQNAFLASPLYRRFLIAMAGARNPCGRLAVMTLTLDGRIIAAKIGTIDSERFEGFVTVYDEAYRSWSPGSILLAECLSWCFANERSYDFRIGDEDYKRLWATGSRLLTTHVTALDRRGAAALALRSWGADLDRLLARIRARMPERLRAAIRALRRKSPVATDTTTSITEIRNAA